MSHSVDWFLAFEQISKRKTNSVRVSGTISSTKDAGKKLSALTEFTEGAVKQSLHDVIAKMLGNPELVLN